MLGNRKETGLSEVQKNIAYPFQDPSRLEQALTHRSFTNEHPELQGKNNERLEFLGDAVLNLSLSHLLIEQFPDLPEGDLSKIRAGLVNESHLAALALELRLGDYLLIGRGEEITGGRKKPSILADTLEAVLGAVYLDGGLGPVSEWVSRFFKSHLSDQEGLPIGDFKTLLQEYCQGKLKITPSYTVFREEGPDHKKVFFVEVRIRDQVISRGKGKTKKEAQQKAAQKALEGLTKNS